MRVHTTSRPVFGDDGMIIGHERVDIPYTPEEEAERDAEESAERVDIDVRMVSDKIDQLWRAADAYTSKYISGVAIGLLTIGVMQQKPKALAVQAWSAGVWDDYYQRKATVTATSAADLDFSSHGPMPHSVPELRAELGM